MNERRILYLLIVVLLGHLVLVLTQASDPDAPESVLERSLLRLVAPVTQGVSSLTRSVGGVGENIQSREALAGENQRLASELEALRLEVFRLRNVERLVDRLSEAVAYTPPPDLDFQVADVVYADTSSLLGTLMVHVGDLGVERNQPVVAPDGLVGRLILASGPYAKVQLLTDRSTTVGAMIERTRRQGLIRGGPDNELTLEYVPLQDDVQVGDRIRTSGIDGVYPPGIVIGRVVSVEPGGELFHDIRVMPAVDFGKLDQVYLLEGVTSPAETIEEGD